MISTDFSTFSKTVIGGVTPYRVPEKDHKRRTDFWLNAKYRLCEQSSHIGDFLNNPMDFNISDPTAHLLAKLAKEKKICTPPVGNIS